MIENMVAASDVATLARAKSRLFDTKSVNPSLAEQHVAEGWETIKKGKTSVRLKRPKSALTSLGDRLWTLLFRMQMDLISGPGGAKVTPDKKSAVSTDWLVPIVGVDTELILAMDYFVPTKGSKGLTDRLADFSGCREQLVKSIGSQYAGLHKRHCALLFFVRDIQVSEEQRAVAKSLNISIFDEKDLDYYEKLTSHLGPAAKYQFFSDILPGKSIPGLEIRVPAVKTKMGGHNCYTFPISPEYLLKIAYVSHRSKGKASDINTYQRMISKARLRTIRDYISESGIFPTNIVVNLEKKCVDFQKTKQENSNEEVDASGVSGWLRLRPAYKSAWIIDGQHRLFAYSGHSRARTSHLAVLAFEGIPASTQARLFVDINAKQKSVKPSLLQELFAELHWDASSPTIRVQAIISKAVQILDAEKDSPLYGRIQTADAVKDSRRCISLASLFKSIEKQGLFVVKEAREEVLEAGPLWADSSEATLARAVALIKGWLKTVTQGAPEWWELGSAEGGGFAMNDSVAACLNVLKSVLTHLESTGKNLLKPSNKELTALVEPYGSALSKYFARLPIEDRKKYRDLRGVQGQTTRTRRCQQAIREEINSFNPVGLDDFIRGEKEQNNLRAKQIMDRIEIMLRRVIVDELKQEFSADENAWWQEGVPKSVRLEVAKRKENDDNKRGDRDAYFDLIDYRAIATNNWTIFQKLIGLGKKNESKDKQTKWMVELNEWRNQVAHPSSGVILSADTLLQLETYESSLKEKVSAISRSDEDGDIDGSEDASLAEA